MKSPPPAHGDAESESDAFLELFSQFETPLDFDGVLGLLHAIASAPGRVPEEVWLPCVLPEPDEVASPEVMVALREGLLAEFAEVQAALAEGAAFIPEEDEEEAWESFARGYVAGAKLDPKWATDPESWALVGWFAYLGGLREHVPAELLQTLDADQNASDIICDRAPTLLRAIYTEFQSAPQPAGAARSGATPQHPPRLAPGPGSFRKRTHDTQVSPGLHRHSGSTQRPPASAPPTRHTPKTRNIPKDTSARPNSPNRSTSHWGAMNSRPQGTSTERNTHPRSGQPRPGQPRSGQRSGSRGPGRK